jgi:hypothetical protein
MSRSELHFDFRVGAPTLLRLYLGVENDKPFSTAYNQNTCAIVCTRDVLAGEGGLLRGLMLRLRRQCLGMLPSYRPMSSRVGVISAAVYNLVARWIGGIELEVE